MSDEQIGDGFNAAFDSADLNNAESAGRATGEAGKQTTEYPGSTGREERFGARRAQSMLTRLSPWVQRSLAQLSADQSAAQPSAQFSSVQASSAVPVAGPAGGSSLRPSMMLSRPSSTVMRVIATSSTPAVSTATVTGMLPSGAASSATENRSTDAESSPAASETLLPFAMRQTPGLITRFSAGILQRFSETTELPQRYLSEPRPVPGPPVSELPLPGVDEVQRTPETEPAPETQPPPPSPDPGGELGAMSLDELAALFAAEGAADVQRSPDDSSTMQGELPSFSELAAQIRRGGRGGFGATSAGTGSDAPLPGGDAATDDAATGDARPDDTPPGEPPQVQRSTAEESGRDFSIADQIRARIQRAAEARAESSADEQGSDPQSQATQSEDVQRAPDSTVTDTVLPSASADPPANLPEQQASYADRAQLSETSQAAVQGASLPVSSDPDSPNYSQAAHLRARIQRAREAHSGAQDASQAPGMSEPRQSELPQPPPTQSSPPQPAPTSQPETPEVQRRAQDEDAPARFSIAETIRARIEAARARREGGDVPPAPAEAAPEPPAPHQSPDSGESGASDPIAEQIQARIQAARAQSASESVQRQPQSRPQSDPKEPDSPVSAENLDARIQALREQAESSGYAARLPSSQDDITEPVADQPPVQRTAQPDSGAAADSDTPATSQAQSTRGERPRGGFSIADNIAQRIQARRESVQRSTQQGTSSVATSTEPQSSAPGTARPRVTSSVSPPQHSTLEEQIQRARATLQDQSGGGETAQETPSTQAESEPPGAEQADTASTGTQSGAQAVQRTPDTSGEQHGENVSSENVSSENAGGDGAGSEDGASENVTQSSASLPPTTPSAQARPVRQGILRDDSPRTASWQKPAVQRTRMYSRTEILTPERKLPLSSLLDPDHAESGHASADDAASTPATPEATPDPGNTTQDVPSVQRIADESADAPANIPENLPASAEPDTSPPAGDAQSDRAASRESVTPQSDTASSTDASDTLDAPEVQRMPDEDAALPADHLPAAEQTTPAETTRQSPVPASDDTTAHGMHSASQAAIQRSTARSEESTPDAVQTHTSRTGSSQTGTAQTDAEQTGAEQDDAVQRQPQTQRGESREGSQASQDAGGAPRPTAEDASTHSASSRSHSPQETSAPRERVQRTSATPPAKPGPRQASDVRGDASTTVDTGPADTGTTETKPADNMGGGAVSASAAAIQRHASEMSADAAQSDAAQSDGATPDVPPTSATSPAQSTAASTGDSTRESMEVPSSGGTLSDSAPADFAPDVTPAGESGAESAGVQRRPATSGAQAAEESAVHPVELDSSSASDTTVQRASSPGRQTHASDVESARDSGSGLSPAPASDANTSTGQESRPDVTPQANEETVSPAQDVPAPNTSANVAPAQTPQSEQPAGESAVQRSAAAPREQDQAQARREPSMRRGDAAASQIDPDDAQGVEGETVQRTPDTYVLDAHAPDAHALEAPESPQPDRAVDASSPAPDATTSTTSTGSTGGDSTIQRAVDNQDTADQRRGGERPDTAHSPPAQAQPEPTRTARGQAHQKRETQTSSPEGVQRQATADPGDFETDVQRDVARDSTGDMQPDASALPASAPEPESAPEPTPPDPTPPNSTSSNFTAAEPTAAQTPEARPASQARAALRAQLQRMVERQSRQSSPEGGAESSVESVPESHLADVLQRGSDDTSPASPQTGSSQMDSLQSMGKDTTRTQAVEPQRVSDVAEKPALSPLLQRMTDPRLLSTPRITPAVLPQARRSLIQRELTDEATGTETSVEAAPEPLSEPPPDDQSGTSADISTGSSSTPNLQAPSSQTPSSQTASSQSSTPGSSSSRSSWNVSPTSTGDDSAAMPLVSPRARIAPGAHRAGSQDPVPDSEDYTGSTPRSSTGNALEVGATDSSSSSSSSSDSSGDSAGDSTTHIVQDSLDTLTSSTGARPRSFTRRSSSGGRRSDGPNLDEIARQIMPLIRRMLAVERERRPSR